MSKPADEADIDCIICGGTGEVMECGFCMLNIPHEEHKFVYVGPCLCMNVKRNCTDNSEN